MVETDCAIGSYGGPWIVRNSVLPFMCCSRIADVFVVNYENKKTVLCTAIENLDHYLRLDCDIITI